MLDQYVWSDNEAISRLMPSISVMQPVDT